MTVSGDVTLGAVSVSAQSGWNSDTSFTVHVKRRTKECYSNAEGPEHSR